MITGCKCFKLSFQEILDLAAAADVKSYIGVRKKLNICNKCSKCSRYIKESFVSGETEFPGSYERRNSLL